MDHVQIDTPYINNKNLIIPLFKLHKRRIEYFSYHVIGVLNNYRKYNQDLLDLLLGNDFDPERLDKAKIQVNSSVEFLRQYIIPMVDYWVKEAANFISNGLIVHKLVDNLNGLLFLYNPISGYLESNEKHNAVDYVKMVIGHLDEYINYLQDERRRLFLEPLPLKD